MEQQKLESLFIGMMAESTNMDTITMMKCNALGSVLMQDHPHGSGKIHRTDETLEEVGVHDPIKVLDQSTYKFYNWLPWDLGGFGHSIVYFRVAQQRLDGGLLISIEFNYAHMILKRHGVSNSYSYPRPHLVWDPGVCGLLQDK